jgi:uncharacterized membrane protein
MPKNRFESFSGGVIAIVITPLVLEIHAPPMKTTAISREMLAAHLVLAPSFLANVISFLVCAVW